MYKKLLLTSVFVTAAIHADDVNKLQENIEVAKHHPVATQSWLSDQHKRTLAKYACVGAIGSALRVQRSLSIPTALFCFWYAYAPKVYTESGAINPLSTLGSIVRFRYEELIVQLSDYKNELEQKQQQGKEQAQGDDKKVEKAAKQPAPQDVKNK